MNKTRKPRMTKSEKAWFKAQDPKNLSEGNRKQWLYLWANKTY